MDQAGLVPPSMPSAPLAVAFTLPVLVIVNGVSVVANVRVLVSAVLIVRPPPLKLTVNVSVAEGAELGPPAAACVAVTEWLALLNGVGGVKLHALATTFAVPATRPSID